MGQIDNVKHLAEYKISSEFALIQSDLIRYCNAFEGIAKLSGAAPEYVVPAEDRQRIIDICLRNNFIASTLKSPEFGNLKRKEKILRGKCKIGKIKCVDGRLPRSLTEGVTVNAWDFGAGDIAVRGEGENVIVADFFLDQAIAGTAEEDDNDFLELVEGHYSSILHKNCGRLAQMLDGGLRKKLGITDEMSDEEVNIRLYESKTIPAITNTYNYHRKKYGKPELKQVAVATMFDTDTFGVTLNFGKNKNSLSTTELMNGVFSQGEDTIENLLSGYFGKSGSLSELVHDTEHYIDIYRAIVEATTYVQHWSKFQDIVGTYINNSYPDMTEKQKQGLAFYIARTISVQYLTGYHTFSANNEPVHPFAAHHESYMAFAPDGKYTGSLEIENQVFGTSSSSVSEAQAHIKLEYGIMERHGDEKPKIIFVSNLVSENSWNNRKSEPGKESIRRIKANLSRYYSKICEDPEIRQLILSGRMHIVPVLIHQDTKEVLDIADDIAQTFLFKQRD